MDKYKTAGVLNVCINAYDRLTNYTLLMEATLLGHTQMVKLLLTVPNIKINKIDDAGSTALMIAASKGHTKIVEILLQLPSIDIMFMNNDGYSAASLAQMNGHVQIANQLNQLMQYYDAPMTVLNSPVMEDKIAKKQIEAAYLAGKHEAELNHAKTLSSAELVEKQGIFSNSIAKKESLQAKDEVEVPEAFLCPITQEIMKHPTFCTLDCRSYEKSAISEWLTKSRYSPFSRAAMKENETLEDVLKRNLALEDAIAEFNELSNKAPQPK